MEKAEVMRRLHEMVDQLESVPADWFLEGVYPLHKVTFVAKDNGERVTLVVGVADRDN